MAVKYSKEQRRKMAFIVKQSIKQGLKAKVVADKFNEQGYKTTIGKSFTDKDVHNFMRFMGGRPIIRIKKKQTVLRAKEQDDSVELRKLILASNLSDSKKVGLLIKLDGVV